MAGIISTNLALVNTPEFSQKYWIFFTFIFSNTITFSNSRPHSTPDKKTCSTVLT